MIFRAGPGRLPERSPADRNSQRKLERGYPSSLSVMKSALGDKNDAVFDRVDQPMLAVYAA